MRGPGAPGRGPVFSGTTPARWAGRGPRRPGARGVLPEPRSPSWRRSHPTLGSATHFSPETASQSRGSPRPLAGPWTEEQTPSQLLAGSGRPRGPDGCGCQPARGAGSVCGARRGVRGEGVWGAELARTAPREASPPCSRTRPWRKPQAHRAALGPRPQRRGSSTPGSPGKGTPRRHRARVVGQRRPPEDGHDDPQQVRAGGAPGARPPQVALCARETLIPSALSCPPCHRGWHPG